MSYCGRKKYYMAEQERLVECAVTLRDIFSQDNAVNDLCVARNILVEMLARLDTWDRLRAGLYDSFCTHEEFTEKER